MSMPRVGSSRIRTLGLRASQRASTTFCWLPPESLRTSCSIEGVRTRSRSVYSWASSRSAPRLTKRKRRRRSRTTVLVLSRMERCRNRAWALRSSGARPRPARTAAPGLPVRRGRPSRVTVPERTGRSPARARASSERPAPMSPARPTTSPAWTCRLMSWTSSVVTFRTSRTRRSVATRVRENMADRSRPTIRRTRSPSVVVAASWTPARVPSRRTAMRSASWKISCIRWET